MEIKELQKKDFQKVIEYAISGMHFEEYLTNKFMLNIYGRYFWYLEYINATQVIAAYEDKKLLGVLVADIKGEEKPYKSVGKGLYVKLIDIIQNLFFSGGVMPYNEAAPNIRASQCLIRLRLFYIFVFLCLSLDRVR